MVSVRIRSRAKVAASAATPGCLPAHNQGHSKECLPDQHNFAAQHNFVAQHQFLAQQKFGPWHYFEA